MKSRSSWVLVALVLSVIPYDSRAQDVRAVRQTETMTEERASSEFSTELGATTATHPASPDQTAVSDLGGIAGSCTIPCQSGDRIEDEPNCFDGYVDEFNGGCNSTPNVFGAISDGQIVCGRYGTYRTSGQNFGDSDWYEFTLSESAMVTWTVLGEARTEVSILRASCPATLLTTRTEDACRLSRLTIGLLAGTYYARVAATVTPAASCNSRYRATLTTEPCLGACQPHDRVEGEAVCGDDYEDDSNGGCDSNPPAFEGTLECGETVCGSYGTYVRSGTSVRDTDWYEFTLPQAVNVTWTAIGEARTRVDILREGCPAQPVATGVANGCVPAKATAHLASGRYYASVATDVSSGVPCGSKYRANLITEPCSSAYCMPGDLTEGEPICSDGYEDYFNAGCNTTPNVFNPIGCVQNLCGTYGTYIDPTRGYTRDTDWYEFHLPAAADVTWTVMGEARTRVIILRGPCPSEFVAAAEADPFQFAAAYGLNVPPGSYYAFVATDSFTGVPCGSSYHATLTADCSCERQCHLCDSEAQCIADPSPCEGAACTDDGYSCTDDVCVDGVCEHPVRTDLCDDGSSCTTEACDPSDPAADAASGCVITPIDSRCDDGDRCTTDYCDPSAGAPVTGCVMLDNGLCGACCHHTSASCTDSALFVECINPASSDEFFLNETCADVENTGRCTQHLGACCDHNPFGSCSETDRDECGCVTCDWHKLRTCEEITCVQAVIPAMSTWALLVLALCLVIGAKLKFAAPADRSASSS